MSNQRSPRSANVVRIPTPALNQLQALQRDIEAVVGVRPTMPTLISQVVSHGTEAMRRRPALAVDTAPRKGDV